MLLVKVGLRCLVASKSGVVERTLAFVTILFHQANATVLTFQHASAFIAADAAARC